MRGVLTSRRLERMMGFETRELYHDLADIYPVGFPAHNSVTGEVGAPIYGPGATYSDIECYRQAKQEIKATSPIGQYLETNIFTTDVFWFAISDVTKPNPYSIGSNDFLLYKSLLRNGNKHPDYFMWFSVVGQPQVLTVDGYNRLAVLCKRSTAPNGVFIGGIQ